MKPTLSILTPAIWIRMEKANELALEIEGQIQMLPSSAFQVEHLVLFDNQTRSVGMKRQALLDSARGKYIAFVDDDDAVAGNYVAQLLKAASYDPDVITFKQQAEINGKVGYIHFDGATGDDPPWQEGQIVKRAPWHVCAWKRELVKDCIFPDIMDGEDLAWSKQARLNVKSAAHIDAVLHTYVFDSETTAASGKTFGN